MRTSGRRRSSNIEDRRGARRGGLVMGGGLGTIVIIVLALFFGVDPTAFLQGGGPVTGNSSPPAVTSPEESARAETVAVTLASTEDVWNELFAREGFDYAEPSLVLFTDATPSACGYGQAAMGPFYCPRDRKVYIDLGFFDALQRRFGAPGDFAQAYVVAHEVGHHVQTLTGTSERVHAERSRVDAATANRLSVMQELQADCLAGVWAYYANRTQRIVEPGDIDEALNAASAIGDDRLQQQTRGRVVPESFTHGTSAQRQRWFRIGFETGDYDQCDTFSAATL